MVRIIVFLAFLLPSLLSAQIHISDFHFGFLYTGGSTQSEFTATPKRVFSAETGTGQRSNSAFVVGWPAKSPTQVGVGIGWSFNQVSLPGGVQLSNDAFGLGFFADFEIAPNDIRLEGASINSKGWNIPIYVEHAFRSKTKNRDFLRLRAGIRNQFFTKNTYGYSASIEREPDQVVTSGTVFDLIFVPIQLLTLNLDDRESIQLNETPYGEGIRGYYANAQNTYAADFLLQAELPLFVKGYRGLSLTLGIERTLRPTSSLIDKTTGKTFGLNVRF